MGECGRRANLTARQKSTRNTSCLAKVHFAAKSHYYCDQHDRLVLVPGMPDSQAQGRQLKRALHSARGQREEFLITSADELACP